ncbi:hypothetical protein OG250_29480 [Streptomyces sp. NBC_00487]|uniref:hypothetical protein n=1 Tax=unclassified Streptomyces TaxID=2593676 RepID=UPI002DDAE716|nr:MULTISPECIES: hypothetical protein [unclassified Streptomyces]WRY98603.1 hypothetical protein OG889_30250 [Streptomyces sp. NBC_00481]
MTLPDPTPYDADRAAFSREALARLALSSSARGTAGGAMGLVATRNDVDTGLGGRAGQAAGLVEAARGVLSRAVVYERERGATWEQIAHYLEIEPAEAEARYEPALARWREAFDVPYRLDATGRKRVPQLPTAAYDPAYAVRQLDLWAYLYVVRGDRRAVSGGLPGYVPADDEDTCPSPHGPDDLGGRVRADSVRPLLEQLSHYVTRDPYAVEDIDWDALTAALATTDDTNDRDPAAWATHAFDGFLGTVRVRLARSARADAVSAVVTGADSADLRLRVDTLLNVFAAPPA